MRDDIFLKNRLETIWATSFKDVPQKNTVYIHFGKKARTRLGSIRRSGAKDTEITITGFFKDERVPEFMIDATIAHELCHYAHGFFSPLPQLSRYPHQGGLVDSELIKRGFGDQLLAQKRWLKSEWPTIIGSSKFPRRKVARRKTHPGIELLKFLISN